MAVQQFCLRWNNHQPNFISVFTNLLINESLVDVTLAAEGKQLKAHKVVLSACSTYFQSLFTANPCQHPIVILKDVKYKDLKTMVDFMYKGEVNVSQEQLPAILKTAETLKVKGLAEMPEQLSLSKSMSQSSDKCDSPPASAVASTVLRRKRFRKSSTGSGSEQTSEELAASGGTDVSSVKHEPAEEHASHHRRDTSTESEPTTREGSHSFDDEASTPRNISEDAGDSNIRWSSSEDKASTSQGAPQGWTFLESYSLPSSAETGDNSGSYQFQYTAATPGSRRKRSSNPQQDENFIAALEAVRTGGLGFCKAAKLYGVNNRTLWLEYKKRGYPVMRPSTKMRSAALNGSSVIKREKDATGSGDCMQKIKLSSFSAYSSNSPSALQDPSVQPCVVEPVPTPSMGSKRGRLLMRQHRIKKDLEMSQAEGEGESSSQRVIERQCSEPAPNLLTVPQQSYLIKQNSSPHLSQLTTPVTTSIPTVHIQAPSSEASGPIPLMSTRIRGEELRRSTSSPQCSGSGTDACEGSRSCHCPVLRPGPALGCNFCWNTIDTHGRILRRKTKYHCPECQTNLCIVPCFQEYHERHGSGSGYKGGSSSTCSPASASGTFPTIMKTSSL